MIANDVIGGLSADMKVWLRFAILPIAAIFFFRLFNVGLLDLTVFACANVIGIAIAIVLSQDYLVKFDILRYNLAPWLVWAALLLTDRWRSATTQVAAVALVAMCAAAAGLRSVALAAVFVLLLRMWVSRPALRFRPNARVVVGAVLAAIFLSGAALAFNALALSGALGSTLQHKQMYQTSAREGFLAASRPLTQFELQAALAAPFLGSGSSPKNAEVVGAMLRAAESQGRDWILRRASREDVETHSLFFDAWIRSGILGAVAWVSIFLMTAGVLLAQVRSGVFFGFGDNFLFVFLLGNVLFSPMSPQLRILTALTIAISAQRVGAFQGRGKRS